MARIKVIMMNPEGNEFCIVKNLTGGTIASHTHHH
jgi:hypothetical protein